MGRVPKALRRVDASLEAEAVHRLRVALRRCRSLAALMEVEELTNESAETVFKRLGGKNKFGRAYSVLWQAVEDYDTIEAFRAVVNCEIGPIVEIEEKVAEPEAKRARV